MVPPLHADVVARWQDAIGAAHVILDDPARVRAATTTFATDAVVLAILRPADRAQVQICVRIAHEHHVPLHVISGGRNWGYGSRAPARAAAILDLGRLDRIVDFDERLAYVTVEPGVTFGQLASFLRECRARVFASVTGGPAAGSVVANALERGDGSGPRGDRFAHVCGLEVVLPTGECVHTGFARFAGNSSAPISRWGVGASLDGLFSQSGLGIVTRMTVWLTPYPAHFQLAAFTIDDELQLPAIVDALRCLRLSGVATTTVPLWNDIKALALVTRYPWEEAGGVTPLPPQLRATLRQTANLGRWNGTVSLYGASRAHGAALRDVVADALAPTARIEFHEGPEDPLSVEPDVCGPGLGVPHDRNVASMYWRKRCAVGDDPDLDRCGFLWLSHSMPFLGGAASDVSRHVEAELTAAGFEPSLALLGVTERALSLVVSLAYDRDVAGEDERARACHDRLFGQLVDRGYPPFRGGIQSHSLVPAGDVATARFVESLRTTIDPHDVLSLRRS